MQSVVKESSSSHGGWVACPRRVRDSLVKTKKRALVAEDGSRKQRGDRESERAKERAERNRHRARVEHVSLSSHRLAVAVDLDLHAMRSQYFYAL
jgi:hypothetical protein